MNEDWNRKRERQFTRNFLRAGLERNPIGSVACAYSSNFLQKIGWRQLVPTNRAGG